MPISEGAHRPGRELCTAHPDELEISWWHREEMPDFKWDDLKGKKVLGGRNRWHAYINVNYETIVILCNWVDGLNSAKKR